MIARPVTVTYYSTMRRCVLTFIALFLFCFVSHGQTSTPDGGSVKDGVYSDTFFGFSYAYPKDWVVHGEATKAHIKELGQEQAKETKALPDASVEVALAHTYLLLTVARYQLGTPGVKDNALVQVVAEDVRHAPAIINGRVYLLNVHDVLIKMGAQPLQAEPVEVVFSSQKFFRLDFEQPVNGKPIHTAMLAIVSKGYGLTFIFTAIDQKEVDELVKTMESLKFSVTAR
jgi:hypothetical protein